MLALKVKYQDVQEHTGVKHSYLGTSLDMSEVGMCSITMPMLIAGVLKDVKFWRVVTPASSTFLMINEIVWFSVAQLLDLGKGIRIDIPTAVPFLMVDWVYLWRCLQLHCMQ